METPEKEPVFFDVGSVFCRGYLHDGFPCLRHAQGENGMCIRHGGGLRCTVAGCIRSSLRKSGLCGRHGGGNRCTFEGCTKGATNGMNFCHTHGGFRRCLSKDCSAQAVGRGDRKPAEWCVNHGGGKRCKTVDCNMLVYRSADMCTYHGGGRSCAVRGCNKLSIINGLRCSVHTLINDGMLQKPVALPPVVALPPMPVPVPLPVETPFAPAAPVAARVKRVADKKRKIRSSAPLDEPEYLPPKRVRKPSVKALPEPIPESVAVPFLPPGQTMIYREPFENIFVYKLVDNLSEEPGVEGVDYFRVV